MAQADVTQQAITILILYYQLIKIFFYNLHLFLSYKFPLLILNLMSKITTKSLILILNLKESIIDDKLITS